MQCHSTCNPYACTGSPVADWLSESDSLTAWCCLFVGDEDKVSYMFNSVGLFPSPLGRHAKTANVNKVKSRFRLLGKVMAKAVMDSRMVINTNIILCCLSMMDNQILCSLLFCYWNINVNLVDSTIFMVKKIYVLSIFFLAGHSSESSIL